MTLIVTSPVAHRKYIEITRHWDNKQLLEAFGSDFQGLQRPNYPTWRNYGAKLELGVAR